MGIKRKTCEVLLGNNSEYFNDFNKCSINNECNSNDFELLQYLAKLTTARLSGIPSKKVDIPKGLTKIPVIESQFSKRPGEKKFLERLLTYDVISFDIFACSL